MPLHAFHGSNSSSSSCRRWTADASPSLWQDQWAAYFLASLMDRLSPDEQKAFFFRCMDHLAIIRPDIPADMPINSDRAGPSCMRILTERFLIRYPMLQRRFDWLTARRADHEGIGAWYARFKQRGMEADLDNATRDDLMILGIVMNLNDASVANRIVRLENPTMPAAEKILTASQVTSNASAVQQKAQAAGSAEVNAAQPAKN